MQRVQIPNGHAYAIAIVTEQNGGSDQTIYDDVQCPTVEYISCEVYHAIAGDSDAGCKHP